jgi:hypothetical protein
MPFLEEFFVAEGWEFNLMLQEHREPGHRLLTALTDRYGMPPSTLQRIAALIVLWGTFEGELERTLWRLSGEDPTGKTPTTDKMQLSQKLRRLRELAGSSAGKDWNDTIKLICELAGNLKLYRDAIVHGRLLPSSVGGGFVLNPGWHGERRKRRGTVAHIDDRLVGIMLDAFYELTAALQVIVHGDSMQEIIAGVLGRRDNIKTAKSHSGEIIHLTELMNSETY